MGNEQFVFGLTGDMGDLVNTGFLVAKAGHASCPACKLLDAWYATVNLSVPEYSGNVDYDHAHAFTTVDMARGRVNNKGVHGRHSAIGNMCSLKGRSWEQGCFGHG